MESSTRIHTKNLVSDTFTFSKTMNIMRCTLLVSSGTLNITGNMPFAGSNTNDTGSLPVGTTLTLSDEGGAPLDGIVLTSVGGTTFLIFGF